MVVVVYSTTAFVYYFPSAPAGDGLIGSIGKHHLTHICYWNRILHHASCNMNYENPDPIRYATPAVQTGRMSHDDTLWLQKLHRGNAGLVSNALVAI